MEIGDVLRYLPPLCLKLKFVSRNFYRAINKAHRNLGYWRSRSDAPRRPMKRADSYLIYYMSMKNAGRAAYCGYWTFDTSAYSPEAFTEAFPVVWDNLPKTGERGVPDGYPYELGAECIQRGAIGDVCILISRLITEGEVSHRVGPHY